MNAIEHRWEDLKPEQRQVVIDVREPYEIREGEWDFFAADGAEVEHFPFTRWAWERPEWKSDRTYLVVCAHGVRSAAALSAVPQGVRACSLAGGVAGLDLN